MKPYLPFLIPMLVLAAPVARAQDPYQTRQLPPGGWDVRAGLESDGLLAHAGGQLAADVGLFPAGDGMLAGGVEVAFSRCLTACGSGGGLLVDRAALTPLARVAWHFPVGAQTANVTEVDLYLLAVGGASFTFQQAENSGFRVARDEIVPVAGAGIGSLYFPGNGDTIFAGGELRVLWAQATRATTAAGVTLTAWSLSGVRLVFTTGVRL